MDTEGINMEKSLSEKIYYLRKKNGLTLEAVANVVGVGKSTVRKWETGTIANMRRDKIALLAEALHTTPAYLMGWEENIAPDELRVTESDKEILELFKQIPEKDRRVLLEMVRSYANTLNKD